MKIATGDSVLRAYSKAVKTIQHDNKMIGSEVSAGFIIPDGQKRGQRDGFQVFVKVYRFSKDLLEKHMTSGGLMVLLANMKPSTKKLDPKYSRFLKKIYRKKSASKP